MWREDSCGGPEKRYFDMHVRGSYNVEGGQLWWTRKEIL